MWQSISLSDDAVGLPADRVGLRDDPDASLRPRKHDRLVFRLIWAKPKKKIRDNDTIASTSAFTFLYYLVVYRRPDAITVGIRNVWCSWKEAKISAVNGTKARASSDN